MSSLAAASADGYYRPPDHDPRREGSLNRRHGRRPAGAPGPDGAVAVRFELPFAVRCARCDARLAAGVRATARKEKAGAYYSTTIWRFTFRARCCANTLSIRTDPQNCAYVVESGAVRVADAPEGDVHDPDDGRHVVDVADELEAMRDAADPFVGAAKVQRRREAQRQARTEAARIAELREVEGRRSADAYVLNKALRREARAQRKEAAQRDAERQGLALPAHVTLLRPDPADAAAAAAVQFGAPVRERFQEARREKRAAIRSESIFGGGAAAAPAAATAAAAATAPAKLLAKRRRLERAGAVLRPPGR